MKSLAEYLLLFSSLAVLLLCFAMIVIWLRRIFRGR